MKPCKDCLAAGLTEGVPERKWRPAPHPGPRCTTHHRAKRNADRLRAHALRTEANFGITGEQYWEVYEFQGGRCFVCQHARGLRRRLAVDHDHKLCDGHPPDKGCPRCIRALLCVSCNELLGRYGVDALMRAIEVLTDPPARKVLAWVVG